MNGISVIIPTKNEVEHIGTLVERIDTTFSNRNTLYEIIIVDDHSTDGTLKIIQDLSSRFPITLQTKKGKPGKAFSLIEGFTAVQHDLIATIDADLQYPPEAIAEMMNLISSDIDVVVAERNSEHPSLSRRLGASFYRKFFVEFLHRLPFDTQSGLKVFKTDIARRLPLSPQSWTLDLEFLLKARQAGYVISSQPVAFQARKTNGIRTSNYKLLTAISQMAGASIKQKLIRPSIIPFLPAQMKEFGKGFHYNCKKFVTHNELNPHKTALYRMHYVHSIALFVIVAVIGVGLFFNWHYTVLILLAGLTFLYFSDLLFNFYLIIRSFSNSSEITIAEDEFEHIPDEHWPMYTIFCPLYKEPEVIPQFITAMSKMNYPQDKLQVMLLLEADDTETVAKARSMNLPSYFEIQVVPDSLPKTKPKACNYGLIHAKGDYVVIYDAEDIPDPDQLKKAVIAFHKESKKVVCIQAKLNFYNPHQNLLTRVFTAEYSLWFDLVLTGIQSIHAPIPLGGTSNHFRTKDLLLLEGWDAFNVTEDCDLGMRLVKKGYRTAILDSTTLEEANSDLANWFWQRSRWIKGYMQSYLVHMRDPQAFLGDWKRPHAITFQLIVGGKVLSMLVNPLMWLITISYFIFRAYVGDMIDSFFPSYLFYMAVFSLVFGNFLYLYYYMIGCAKRGHEDLIKYAAFIPLYWLAMSLAAYMAVYKLLTAPHHWSKTKHGLHLNNEKAMAQTNEKIRLATKKQVSISV